MFQIVFAHYLFTLSFSLLLFEISETVTIYNTFNSKSLSDFRKVLCYNNVKYDFTTEM